jgi:hypothetical protein
MDSLGNVPLGPALEGENPLKWPFFTSPGSSGSRFQAAAGKLLANPGKPDCRFHASLQGGRRKNLSSVAAGTIEQAGGSTMKELGYDLGMDADADRQEVKG